MVPEAKLVRTEGGLVPEGEGWFVVNARETRWERNEAFGRWCRFEGDAQFPHYGINLSVVEPGKPSCMYHGENEQEDFLVLSGECLAIVEGQERPLKAWDFLHCPPGTEHILVGAGDGPCVIFMAGARAHRGQQVYTRDETAIKHGAGVETETPHSKEAYAPYPKWRNGPPERMPI